MHFNKKLGGEREFIEKEGLQFPSIFYLKFYFYFSKIKI